MNPLIGRREVPARALLLTLGALAVPVVTQVWGSDWVESELGILVWLSALIPAFLLTYYRGWQGASLALAMGMVALTGTQVAVVSLELSPPRWDLLFGVVGLFLAVGFGIGLLSELLHRERKAAEQLALSDPLTLLPNRRQAEFVLERAVAAADRGSPLSVVFFDLDHFKAFNDTHGHAAGDEVLRIFGRTLSGIIRKADVAARFGGEEFVAVLWGSDRDGARAFLHRLTTQLASEPTRWGPIRVSAGVACYSPEFSSAERLISAADQALYAAKAAGRNRFFLADPDGVPVPFPTTPTEGAAIGGGSGPSEGPAARGPSRLVLVHPAGEERTSLARLLARVGFDVVQQDTASAALDALARGEIQPPDLVLAPAPEAVLRGIAAEAPEVPAELQSGGGSAPGR